MKKFLEPTLYKIPIQKPIKLEKMTEKQIEHLKKIIALNTTVKF